MPRRCLNCGFAVAAADHLCPKCDSQIAGQTDGSMATIDIAHSKQRTHEAIEQLRSAIATHERISTQFLRVIVGGDRIHKAAIVELQQMLARGLILKFGHEHRNQGALIVVLKRAR